MQVARAEIGRESLRQQRLEQVLAVFDFEAVLAREIAVVFFDEDIFQDRKAVLARERLEGDEGVRPPAGRKGAGARLDGLDVVGAVQGDVGAGKTVIAALSALDAIEAGYQAALMAPTEILAEQHYLKLRQWWESLGLTVVWLSGSLKKSQRQAALKQIANGEACLAVGTHALFQEDVAFARLGLTIVDEQHRFGVAQRLALQAKGGETHQLMMSATPIPRTLAMSYYADLDVSVIDELPPGRTPIRTRLIAAKRFR